MGNKSRSKVIKFPGLIHRSYHKMRYLDFRNIEETKNVYEMIYDGLHGAGGYSGPTEIRLIDKVLTKLESVGEATRELAPTFKAYSLTKGGIVALEDTEYNLMKSKLESVQWVAIQRARVVKMYDFVDGASTVNLALIHQPE